MSMALWRASLASVSRPCCAGIAVPTMSGQRPVVVLADHSHNTLAVFAHLKSETEPPALPLAFLNLGLSRTLRTGHRLLLLLFCIRTPSLVRRRSARNALHPVAGTDGTLPTLECNPSPADRVAPGRVLARSALFVGHGRHV
jgi:hypothetical protein